MNSVIKTLKHLGNHIQNLKPYIRVNPCYKVLRRNVFMREQGDKYGIQFFFVLNCMQKKTTH